MSSTFWNSYINEVKSNQSNWYEDNYDFRRFGPQPSALSLGYISEGILKHLHNKGWVIEFLQSKGIKTATHLVDSHLAHFEWLFNRLADAESRDILIRVLAFRALGYHRVKLPLNTPTYWDELKQVERLADPTDFIRSGF